MSHPYSAKQQSDHLAVPRPQPCVVRQHFRPPRFGCPIPFFAVSFQEHHSEPELLTGLGLGFRSLTLSLIPTHEPVFPPDKWDDSTDTAPLNANYEKQASNGGLDMHVNSRTYAVEICVPHGGPMMVV